MRCRRFSPRRSTITRGLYALLAAMVKSNEQLFSLYVGYDDGSFIEMDDIGGTGRDSRARLEAPEHAAFRLVVISRSGPAQSNRDGCFCPTSSKPSGNYRVRSTTIRASAPGTRMALRRDGSWLTGPYIFFATGRQGYTVQSALKQGRGGVVAGDLLMDATQEVLKREKLTASGRRLPVRRRRSHPGPSPDVRIARKRGAGHHSPPARDRYGRCSEGDPRLAREWDCRAVLCDPTGRLYAAAFQTIPRSGAANLRVAVVAPVDEFFADIVSERSTAVCRHARFRRSHGCRSCSSSVRCSRDRCERLRDDTDRIQRFEPARRPPCIRSIREIDDLGRSVSTMRSLVRTFSSFVPKRIVQQLVETGDAMTLGGTRREVTVLFTDVVDFTGLTENGRSRRRDAVHLALLRGDVAGDHGQPGHGRQIHRRRRDGDLERADRG